jgi:hypothetical protein
MTANPAAHLPSAVELLGAWERASEQSALARPIALLCAAGGEPDEMTRLPIGERDRRLLLLRARLFGPTLAAVADCPRCGEAAEFDVPVDELVAAPRAMSVGTVDVDGQTIEFRLPTTADLSAVVAQSPASLSDAVALVLQRCAGELAESLVDPVAAAIERADPLADATLEVCCPSCGHRWLAPLDIAAFVWREVEAWAERVLAEVDVLARAYGWPERDVLALSPWRRRRYLELATA